MLNSLSQSVCVLLEPAVQVVCFICRKCLWVITAQTAIMQTAKPEGGQSQWEYISLRKMIKG